MNEIPKVAGSEASAAPDIGIVDGRTRRVRSAPLLTKQAAWDAFKQSIVMLRPDIQWKNPVMFVVEVGAILSILYTIQSALGSSASQVPTTYFVALDIWLILTVQFANFATALAEARGKAQAESLRRTRKETIAHRLGKGDILEQVSSTDLRPGDVVVIEAGQVVPRDGEITKGVAMID